MSQPIFKLVHAAIAACLLMSTVSARDREPVDADIVLRNGTIHLGDGQLSQTGSVAIEGAKIVAVGDFTIGAVGQLIDCEGLVVCPGFIDLHNHSDRQVTNPKTRSVINYVTQGCTTIVTGNCGSGPIDVAEYYGKMETHGVGVNVAHLLPQGNLRREVLGEENREATPAELDRMKELAGKAMNDGAWGMSTGLIYVPSSYATTEELVEIAKVIGAGGGIYASHIRNENIQLIDAVHEALEIGQKASIPVHISHFKSSGKDSWGLVRVAVDVIEQARRAGQTVTADQYPYTASSTSISATLFPPWARSGGDDALLGRIKDSVDGPRLLRYVSRKLRELDGGHRLQIAYYAKQPSWAGKRLSEISKEQNLEVYNLVQQILAGGGASIVNHSINEEDVRFVMSNSWVATASDGRAYLPGATVPHPRNYGTFPRKIGHYCARQKVLSLPQAIRGATGLPADILGIDNRGYLRRGYAADIVVFDKQQILDRATFEDPHQYSKGIHFVFINGVPALWKSAPTGALAGRPLCKPSAYSAEG